MAVLDLDLGNTRLKWRLSESHMQVIAGGAVGYGEGASPDFGELKAVIGVQSVRPARVRVSSVRDKNVNERLAGFVLRNWQVAAEFAVTAHSARGLVNAYERVETMGVDRWLAMLAAFERHPAGCCVVAAGTAITVDMVAGDGLHAGGYIVPGLQLMLSSLKQRSSALRYGPTPAWGGVAPGRSTAEAIEHGLVSLVCSWLQQLHGSHSGLSWVFTGGDADMLLPCLDWQVDHVPDLVLDGLALALP